MVKTEKGRIWISGQSSNMDKMKVQILSWYQQPNLNILKHKFEQTNKEHAAKYSGSQGWFLLGKQK